LKGKERQSKWKWKGFYQDESWLFSYDIHGTYTEEVTCPKCKGAGLRPEFLAVTLKGKNIFELSELPINQLESILSQLPPIPDEIPIVDTSLSTIQRRLRFLRQVGIGYLHLNRPIGTLSAGEAQRIQLASLLGSDLTSITILVDEPSRGMHPSELEALLEALQEIRDEGNTVIVVEHDLLLIRAADHVIDLGPKGGAGGGEVVAVGTPSDIIQANTITGKWLQTEQVRSISSEIGLLQWTDKIKRRSLKNWMTVKGACENNLQDIEVKFPLHAFTGVCGVSGSGKSTLLIDTVGRALFKHLHSSSFAREPVEPGVHDSITGQPKRCLIVDQSRRGIRSPASFLKLLKPMTRLFLESDDAQALELGEKDLTRGCSACKGRGILRLDMGFLPNELVECETCKGTGYQPEAWDVRVRGIALPELNQLTLDEIYERFKDEPKIAEPLKLAKEVGLGYLVWNQRSYTLSGGEVQRLKIAKEFQKKTKESTLYILDEPSVGLHIEDVAQLITVLHKLIDVGHTVIVVEHHPHILAACDWIIELGPGGGPDGGKIIAEGTPEAVAESETPTAPYLREILEVKE
jgi:excinuclease ABC subunit A